MSRKIAENPGSPEQNTNPLGSKIELIMMLTLPVIGGSGLGLLVGETLHWSKGPAMLAGVLFAAAGVLLATINRPGGRPDSEFIE